MGIIAFTPFDRLAEFLTSMELFLGLLWAGLAVLSIALLILAHTRWGQSRPLRKCFILSLLAHLLLAGYATTVTIVSSMPATSGDQVIHVRIGEPDREKEQIDREQNNTQKQQDPWEELVHDAVSRPHAPLPQPQPRKSLADDTDLGTEADLDHLPFAETIAQDIKPFDPPSTPSERSNVREPEAIEVPAPQRRHAPIVGLAARKPSKKAPTDVEQIERSAKIGVSSSSLLIDHSPLPLISQPAPIPVSNIIGPPQLTTRRGQSEKKPLPNIYRLRISADRSRLALHNGATAKTEAAVHAALKWLVKNQSPDGRWESGKHQGGRELHIAGRDRLSAGVKADTAITGLSLLALLASGHTHKEGPYQENVRQGLEFLLAGQKPNGSLAGRSTHYAAMYCHAMAAFALSEAYAMTQDPRLEEPVRRAVGYTLAAQDPSGGGWRYTPSDPGDTSQFGWQLMALKSAELAGIPIPKENRRRMLHFIESVSSGRQQGLAAYRPGQTPSRSMTAEALTCRQFLGMPPASATGLEAGDYIIGHLPGEGRANFYYWYYATIGLYQLQGDHWRRWNDALRTTLVQSQRTSGPLAGSWDPNTVWGGYGGRVYSTAIGTLCLEVYYRYLPMYVEAAATQRKFR